jgi:hypothetical protein
VPSTVKIIELPRCLRRHVLSIIWGAIWFWHEKERTVHHLPSYTILTWDDPYRSSFAPDDGHYVSAQVKIIFFPDDGQYVPSTVKII